MWWKETDPHQGFNWKTNRIKIMSDVSMKWDDREVLKTVEDHEDGFEYAQLQHGIRKWDLIELLHRHGFEECESCGRWSREITEGWCESCNEDIWDWE